MACLTYDDGPDPVWTGRVLDVLAPARASATFFVLVDAAASCPDPILRAVEEGHEVALHGHHHLRHSDLTRSELAADTERALIGLDRLGVRPRRWRAPWGVATEYTDELARELDLELVHWTVDTHDWRGDDCQRMLRHCPAELAPDDVVLMHDGLGPGARRRDCAQTVTVTERLLDRAAGPVLSLERAAAS